MRSVVRRALAIIREQLTVLERELAPRPPLRLDEPSPRPRCIACRSESSSESRTVRLLGGDQVLEVCGTCAGLSAHLVASLVEDGIYDGDVRVHHEF